MEHSINNQLLNITIREKFRLKLRDQQIQKSFRQTRQKFILLEKQELNQRNRRKRSAQYQNNPFMKKPSMQNYQNNFHAISRNMSNMQKAFFSPNFPGSPRCQNNPSRGNTNEYRQIIYNQNMIMNGCQQIYGFNNFNEPFGNIGQKFPIRAPQNNTSKLNQPIKIKKDKFVLDKSKSVLTTHENFIVYDEEIGKGAYSKVYLGLNVDTNIKVAIKQITQCQDNQIRVLMSVESPYIIKLQKYWRNSIKNLTYLVLDLCERNLRQELERGITEDQKLIYIEHIIRGIDALFERKIIHRDLKFENILVTKEKTIKITDFGLAKLMDNYSNVQSMRCGTPYTMAPQIYFNQSYSRAIYSQKCDIWSIGVILHEVLYNKHPFSMKSQKLRRMQRTQINKRFGYLDVIIDKALVKNPDQRISWKQLKRIYENKRVPYRITQINEEKYDRQDEKNRNKKIKLAKKQLIQPKKRLQQQQLIKMEENIKRDYIMMNKRMNVPVFQPKMNKRMNVPVFQPKMAQPHLKKNKKQITQKTNVDNKECGFNRGIKQVMNAPKKQQKFKISPSFSPLIDLKDSRTLSISQFSKQICATKPENNKPKINHNGQILLYFMFFGTLLILVYILKNIFVQ